MQKSSKTSQISSDTEAWCWFLVVVRQWWAPGVAQARHRPNAACWKWGSGCGALPLPVLFSPFLWIWQGWGGREETELNRREGGSTQCDHAVNNLKGGKKSIWSLSFTFCLDEGKLLLYGIGWSGGLFVFCFLQWQFSVSEMKWELSPWTCLSHWICCFFLAIFASYLFAPSQTTFFFFFFRPLTIYLW